MSLHIPAGNTVGPLGAARPRFALDSRFYDVTGGTITIDGHDIREVTLASLRHQIGFVQQDVFLFTGTIRENILYGYPQASEEEMIDAAKKAQIHSFILSLPNGYDTYVGERGVKLSGGQKQRISIARVFLKNPPILILDEATSALDTATEQEIQEALLELAKDRTTLVIAHRLSTIRHADQIVVLTDGQIREMGTHQELLERQDLRRAAQQPKRSLVFGSDIAASCFLLYQALPR